MREATGTTWIFGLVVTFIFLFTAFLTLALNYSEAFALRNEVVTMLEKYEGYTLDSKIIINNYLTSNNYNAKGQCPEGYYGANSLTDTGKISLASSSEEYYYCVIQDEKRFEIILFYEFGLPFLGNFTTFNINGETNNINFPNTNGLNK